MVAYSGDKDYQIKPGDSCIACKNHFLRYTKHKEDGDFLKIGGSLFSYSSAKTNVKPVLQE